MVLEETKVKRKRKRKSYFQMGKEHALEFLKSKIESGSLGSLGPGSLGELLIGFSEYYKKMFSDLPAKVRDPVLAGGRFLFAYFLRLWKDRGSPEKALDEILRQSKDRKLETDAKQ